MGGGASKSPAPKLESPQSKNRLVINSTNHLNGAIGGNANSIMGGFRKTSQNKMDLKERLLPKRSTSDFAAAYEIKEELGSGITGTVSLVTDRRNKDRAMKTINLVQINKSQLRELRREVTLLRSLDHPNIIKLIETFEDDHSVILIMDLCRGGTLVSPSGRSRLRTEHAVKTVIYQLFQAIKFIHERGVVHRDIKLENIMFVSEDAKDLRVVLIDFGFSVLETSVSRFGRKKRLFTTNCGTAYYMAPEVLRGYYGKECDVWSLGVMAYILLTGSPPFHGLDTEEIHDAIRRAKPEFTAAIWQRLDCAAMVLVEHLLEEDPAKRWTADQALASKWFKTIKPWSPEDQQLEQNIVSSFTRFANFTKLKKTAMLVLAHHCTGKEVEDLRNLFLNLDSDNSGTISFAELKNVLVRNGGMDECEAQRLFEDADLDGSGGLQLTEFIAATMEATLVIDAQRLGEAFERIARGEEFITVNHLQSLLGNSPQVGEIVAAADLNHDGKISREEFLYIVSEKHEKEVIVPLESAFPMLEKANSARINSAMFYSERASLQTGPSIDGRGEMVCE